MRDTDRAASLRQVIENYLKKRLTDKLKTAKQETETISDMYKLRTWINDAAQRASQLKLATHVLKATHQDARGTNLYCLPHELPEHKYVGTGCLQQIEPDVVGNAAALDVYAFLSLQFKDETILHLLEKQDEDLLQIFSDNEVEAKAIARKFLQIKCSDQNISSSGLAKQVFWLTGENPTDDRQSDDQKFHLLAPLYASSLANTVFEAIQEDRFGETRQLRKKNEYSDKRSADYLNLAVQKFGGSQPQNISKLNSARKGTNYLLASAPPSWKSSGSVLLKRRSVFGPYLLKQKSIGETVHALQEFLKSDPPRNVETREHRDLLLRRICREIFLAIVSEVDVLEPGWSRDNACRLPDIEKYWLDPDRSLIDPEFAEARATSSWQPAVLKSFANWITDALGDELPLGDVEHLFLSEFFEDEIFFPAQSAVANR